MSTKSKKGSEVFLVAGQRTPFLKVKQGPGIFSAADLGVTACQAVLARHPQIRTSLDQVITGSALSAASEANISRVIGLRCGVQAPAFTVQRNCASGLQAIDSARLLIASGEADLVLAGGTDAMSRAPLMFPPAMSAWLAKWMSCKSWQAKCRQLARFRLSLLKPEVALLSGLTDPFTGLSMGQTAENLAYEFSITRQQMDEFAHRSHQHLAQAQESQNLTEITALYAQDGQCYLQDDGLRRDTSSEKLGRLKPFFDKRFGAVTAGNSSQITDGAAFVLLASSDAVTRYHLPVMAEVIDVSWSTLAPEVMGLGPVYAIADLLNKYQLTLNDIEAWEINEAFAAQVLACLQALQTPEFCERELASSQVLGSIPQSRLNIDGGAIAIGHPIGATGARIALHLAEILTRKQATLGIASLCIGGGQGGAILLSTRGI